MTDDPIDKLLASPCLLCGYNGPGYWQRETHNSHCPWRVVAGEEERKAKLPTVIMLRAFEDEMPN